VGGVGACVRFVNGGAVGTCRGTEVGGRGFAHVGAGS
jgi:hypothetical protein